MKLILALLLFPFLATSQTRYDYSTVTNEGNYYPTTPYQQEFYPSREDTTRNVVYAQDAAYSSGHIVSGSYKMVQPAQAYMGVPVAWAHGVTGVSVNVCDIDKSYSGTIAHKDLSVSGVFRNDGDEPRAFVTMSIISARNNGGTGVLGNAYDCNMWVGSNYDVKGSIRWGLSHGCSVFSIPLLLDATDTGMLNAFQEARDSNAIIVTGAGDNNPTVVPMQAICALPDVVCVASINPHLAGNYNNTLHTTSILPVGGRRLAFAAPNYMLGASYDPNVAGSDYYGFQGGSSTAEAQIAGIFALVKQVFPKTPVPILVEMVRAHSKVVFMQSGVTVRVPDISWIR